MFEYSKDDNDAITSDQLTVDEPNINNSNVILTTTVAAPVEKKKRGRKPKNALQNTTQENKDKDKVSDPDNDQGQNQDSDPDKEKNTTDCNSLDQNNGTLKKRGRKASTKIINLTQPDNNSTEMVTNLIAYLPLKMSDISKFISEPNTEQKTDTLKDDKINQTVKNKYIGSFNETFNESFNDSFNDAFNDSFNNSHAKHKNNCGLCMKCVTYEDRITKLEEEIENLKNGIMDSTTNFNKKIFESKVNFFDRSSGEWNEKTDIACWWCCHKFDHIPIGIPEFINKDRFYLFGCFCSFNCMMSYNLDLNDYKIWDRQANIYQMKNRIDPNNKITIHPAPPRQTLQMFGGPLSIRDFRESFFILNKEFRCFFPPMISIIGIIEEDNRDLSGGIKIKHNKMYDEPIIKRRTQLQKQNPLQLLVKKT